MEFYSITRPKETSLKNKHKKINLKQVKVFFKYANRDGCWSENQTLIIFIWKNVMHIK